MMAAGGIKMDMRGHGVTVNPTPEQRLRRALARLERLHQVKEENPAIEPDLRAEAQKHRDTIEAAKASGLLQRELATIVGEHTLAKQALQEAQETFDRLQIICQGAARIGVLKPLE
jgi:TPP-dependent indolepyruvate ferredoxin oxidoreductase alpha subunit